MSTQDFFVFRGVESLYYAKVLKDDAELFECETPKRLAYVKSVGTTKDQTSETIHFDNKPMDVIDSEETTDVTLETSGLTLEQEAEIGGYFFKDGIKTDQKANKDYFALMYTYGKQGPKGMSNRYKVFLKGLFTLGERTVQTRDDGTEYVTQNINYKPIKTMHVFENGNSGEVELEDETLFDFSKFYEQVITPDNKDSIKKAAE